MDLYDFFKENVKSETRENHLCADCKDSKVAWASVNNGVVLCLDCALNHKSVLSSKITFIKSLEIRSWSKDEIDIMIVGGNKKFHEYLISYNINPYEKDLVKKYNSKCVEYYRNFILCETKGVPFQVSRPSLQEGSQILDDKLENNYNEDSKSKQHRQTVGASPLKIETD